MCIQNEVFYLVVYSIGTNGVNGPPRGQRHKGKRGGTLAEYFDVSSAHAVNHVGKKREKRRGAPVLYRRIVESGALPGTPARAWPLLGLWAMHVWIYWFNTSPLRAAAAPAPVWASIYGAMTAVLLAAAVAFHGRPAPQGCWTGNDPGPGATGRHDVAMTAAMCACTVSVAFAGLVDGASVGWTVANVAAAGACMGWGYLRWAEAYAGMGIRTAVACLFGSYLVGSSVKVLLDLLPGIAGAALALALPLVSLAGLRGCAREGLPPGPGAWEGAAAASRPPARREAEPLYSGPGALSSLWRVGLCVLVCCLARQVASLTSGAGSLGSPGMVLSHLVEVAFALAALAWVFRAGRPLDFPQLWRFVFLFLATGIAAGCLAGPSLVVSLCDGVATSLIVMLLWLLLADVAHHSDRHPCEVFGLGWSLYVGANYAGRLLVALCASGPRPFLSAYAGAGPGAGGMALGVALLWATGVAMAFCLETRDPDVQRIFADLRTRVDPEEFATIDRRCDELARTYALTAREADVLRLLAKGRSKNYIAETLYISENTVRGHARRLYAKLGVHTRDELQALLGV